jgi:CRISPR-associated protein Cst1
MFPMGARRCSTASIRGGALAVHSADDPDLTYAFARRFLADNRQRNLLSEGARAPKTLVVHALLQIESERRDSNDENLPASATVYHLSNSGQGPNIDVFHLPCEVVAFLRAVSRASTASAWRGIERAAWEKPEAKKTARAKKTKAGNGNAGEKAAEEGGPGHSRNFLYEDLFDLPANAARFVRTYFLRRSYRYARDQDPRRDYSLSRDRDLVSWELTRLFLKEVIGMEKKRIDAIRELGDRIATHIASENDRRFFQALYRVRRYVDLRNLLIKASNARLKKTQPPLLGFDEFLAVFEEGEETARLDWTLARDLVLIRVIEELHKRGWFGKQPEVLEGLDTDDETGAGAAA